MSEGVRRRTLATKIVGGSSAVRRRGGHVPEPRSHVVHLPEDHQTIEHLLSQNPININAMRMDEHLHVSDLVSKCIRKIALCKESGRPAPKERLMDGHAITFAIGDAVHDFVKEKFVQAHPEKVWAVWACPCGTTREGPVVYSDRAAPTCPSCGMDNTKMEEPVLKHPKLPYTGAMDLPLWIPERQGFMITEIKSMAGKSFAELARPVPDHTVQVSLYWDLMKQAGYPLLDQTAILYVNKEYSFKRVYKPFYLQQPQPALIAPYQQDARDYAMYLSGGKLPPQKVCTSPSSSSAKECPVRMECFARAKKGD